MRINTASAAKIYCKPQGLLRSKSHLPGYILFHLLLFGALLVSSSNAYAKITGAAYIGSIANVTIAEPADQWSLATIYLTGEQGGIIIPSNLVVDLPANRMTMQQFCSQEPSGNPSDCGVNHIAVILANRQDDGTVIAGDVFIHKDDQDRQGLVSEVNSIEGWFKIGDSLMVRFNDPEGVHSDQRGAGCVTGNEGFAGGNCSADPRYTNDPTNYTFTGTSSFPFCINGLNCKTNSGRNGGASATAADSGRFEPLVVGDWVSVSGTIETIGGVSFLSAHTIMVGVAIDTPPNGVNYVIVEEVGTDVPTFANERLKSLDIGVVSSLDHVEISRIVINGGQDCEIDQLTASTRACDQLGGPQTCTGANLNQGNSSAHVVKNVYDWDFTAGESKAFKTPAAVVGRAGDPAGLLVPGDSDANNSLRVFSPMTRDIKYSTEAFLSCQADPNCSLSAKDANGRETQWGFYISPNGVGHPEWGEIDLALFDNPFVFEGLPWNMDRRLGPSGGSERISTDPLGTYALNPFPTSEVGACSLMNGLNAPDESVCLSHVLWDPCSNKVIQVGPTLDGTPTTVPGPGASGLADTDGDGITNDMDNCSLIPNSDQRDTDSDGFGNICDTDVSNDGEVTFNDFNRFQIVWQTGDPDSDFDGDGVVSFSDFNIFVIRWGQPPGPGAE